MLTLSAKQGFVPSQLHLGQIYKNGFPVVKKDYTKALMWYRKAAQTGDPFAVIELAGMYADGKGVPKDGKTSIGMLRTLADKGDATAQALIGFDYRYGIQGVPVDLDEALKWFRLAADQGDETAKESISEIYENIREAQLFPEVPEKVNGVVSCNTQCQNVSCWRTYDNGKKVRFQAKQVFDPFTSQWKFDSGSC